MPVKDFPQSTDRCGVSQIYINHTPPIANGHESTTSLTTDGEDEDWDDLWVWGTDAVQFEFPIREVTSSYGESKNDESDTFIKSNDALSIYMEQMGNVRILSIEQEADLAQRMERGHHAEKQFASQSGLTPKHIEKLRHLIKDGQQARQHFIEANTRLVVSEAKHYRGNGLSFIDLIQAGNIGLIKTVDRFDHRLGNKFSTYAVWWIRQSIRRALTRQGHTIRLPAHIRQRISSYQRTARELEKVLGRQPTLKELSTELGLEDTHGVQRVMQLAQQTLSLNAPVGHEDGEAELLQFLEDEVTPSPPQQVQNHLMQEDIKTLMQNVLTPQELEVLRRHFGLWSCKPVTLAALAEEFGVSRERVLRIELRALRKLRHPSCAFRLHDYLG